MHVVALSNIYNLNLCHPKSTTKKQVPEYFKARTKRGRKTAKAYGKALDKPKVASTPVVSPVSSPDKVT